MKKFIAFALVVAALAGLIWVQNAPATTTVTITKAVVISGTTYTTGNVSVDDNVARLLVNDGKATYVTAPAAANPITFATDKIVASQLSKFSGGVSPDGAAVNTLSSYSGTVALLSGQGSNRLASSPTASTNYTNSDCGKNIFVSTDALTLTFNVTAAGCEFWVYNTGTAGNNIVTLKGNGTNRFFGTLISPGQPTLTGTIGTVVSAATASTLNNTKATAKTGDWVHIVSQGTNTMLISGNTGTWAII